MNNAHTFTAAQIASALGVSRERARQLVNSAAATTTRLVSGNDAPAWQITDLPLRLIERLTSRARELQYESVLQMLQAAQRAWQPPAPLSAVCPEQVDEARRLRDAMQEFAATASRSDVAVASYAAAGVAAFARVFGYSVSERHWRRMLERVLDRASADGDISRLELYLPGQIRAAAAAPKPREQRSYPTLAAELERAASRELDVDSREAIWGAALLDLEDAARAGASPRRAQRELGEFLWKHCPALSRSRAALGKLIRRKAQAWRDARGSVTAIVDGRRANGGLNRWAKLPEEIKGLLDARATKIKGRISQAWRELWIEGKLHREAYDRHSMDWLDKSRLPQSVRDEVKPSVGALKPVHQSARAAKNAEPSILLDHSQMASGDESSWDDQTSNHYVWIGGPAGQPLLGPDGKPRLFRPQILGAEDSASNYITGYTILPKPTYGAVDILQCMKAVHDHMGGLPRLNRFEHGIWERALLIAGRDSVSWEERITGLRQIGIQITHANSAGAKPIELAWKNLQSRTDHWRGFAGREEKRDLPEVTKRALAEVRSGRAHAGEWFMSFDEYCAKYDKMVDAYNDEPQGGKLGGLSPRQAYVEKKTGGPLIFFDDRVRHVFMVSRRSFKVNKNGITINARYRYFGPEVAPLLGKRVIAWFDSEDPSLIVLTDLNHRNSVAVSLVVNPPANQPGSEAMKAALAAKAGHAAWARTYYAKLRRDFPEEFDGQTKRPVIVDDETVRVGAEIETARVEKKAEQRTAALATERVNRAARQIGYTIPENRRNDADEATAALKFLAKRGIRTTNPTEAS